MVLIPLSLSASMTRGKPSVNSRSVSAAGFSWVAVWAMGLPSGLFAVPSVEIIGMPGDVFGEPKRMLAHQVLGALGVARLERLDDVHVVADRAGRTAVLADGLAAEDAPV